ncbi:hypothetical protein niasHS_006932 [Heterodera schachtii]|uniref:C2H2-type domain-containing protein n=1 Tax=Heterodera schachtii TaxID=97005 RepID=A0ABD2JFZ4_HETSC
MDEEQIFQPFDEDNMEQSHNFMDYESGTHDDAIMEQQNDDCIERKSSMVLQEYSVIESEESMLDPHVKPKAVHQCPVCNKIFVSFKGLQQHAIIHTDQKPFECDICRKSFRFKSNLFEHRSVHTGTTPHRCPLCGKTCRLKGNLKKHLRTHCTTKEELEVAWQPFASNRRAPAEIPQDAIIIRANADPSTLFTPLNKPKKQRKLGLGTDVAYWVDRIKRSELLPPVPISSKMSRLANLVKMVEEGSLDMDGLYHHAGAIPFERYECPFCKSVFFSPIECAEHMEADHPNARKQRPHFCDICVRSFADRQQLATHQEHHKRIQSMLQNAELKLTEPQIMMPMLEQEMARDEVEEDGDEGNTEHHNTRQIVDGLGMEDGRTGWDHH